MDVRSYSKQFLTEFIELYKSLPALWKVKCREYSDRNKKTEGYNILVAKLQEVDPNATKDLVIRKINSLRSCRRKEKNKIKESLKSGAGSEEVYQPHLWYYDLLHFLDDQEPRQPVSNFQETLESEEFIGASSSIMEDSLLIDDPEAVDSLAYTVDSPANMVDSPANTEISSGENRRMIPPRRVKKRKGNEVDATLNAIRSRLTSTPPEDSHDAFGRHVAHKLRNLPTQQRIYCEKLINDAIFEAELGNLNRHCLLHTPAEESSQSSMPISVNSATNNINENEGLIQVIVDPNDLPNFLQTYSIK